MRRRLRIFFDISKKEQWFADQKGWKLIKTNGYIHTFEESSNEYNYEYIFFTNAADELTSIKMQMDDEYIEHVCDTHTSALFRKEKSKGELKVFSNDYVKCRMTKSVQKKYRNAANYTLLLFAFNLLLMRDDKFDFDPFNIFLVVMIFLSYIYSYFECLSLKNYSKINDSRNSEKLKDNPWL